MKNRKFRKGDLVLSSVLKDTAVIVTGNGATKEAGYDCFSGVVVMGLRNESNGYLNFTAGTFSDTWNTDAFKKVSKRISDIIRQSITTPNRG